MPRLAPERPVLRGFGPVVDCHIERLILGSFPSEASLAAGQYYAHPRNQFWRLIGDLLAEPLAGMPYARRLQRMLAHRVGLWDVLHACNRDGSADSAIRDGRANQFARLRLLAPKLREVAFNGRAAGRFEREFGSAGFATVVLPSSSPAHAGLSYAQKLAVWRHWWQQGGAAGVGRGQPDRLS